MKVKTDGDTGPSNSSLGRGSGLSRAAKKRAKKRQKKLDSAQRRMDSQKRHIEKQQHERHDSNEQRRNGDNVDSHRNDQEAGQRTKRQRVCEGEGYEGTVKKSEKDLDHIDDKSDDGKLSDDGAGIPPTVAQLISDQLPSLKAGLTASERGRLILQSLLHPSEVSVKEFYTRYWEKRPLHVSVASSSVPATSGARCAGLDNNDEMIHMHGNDRLDGLLSLKDIKTMISCNGLRYRFDLNVTKCDASTGMKRINFDYNEEHGKDRKSKKCDRREVEEEIPDAVDPKTLWRRFRDESCTVRLLCPHKHSDSLHRLLSTLESEFGCMVGCNAYLTPGGESQGFAPHYDDIEAFVLQIEGRKRWRVYNPIGGCETLPRVSSDDFRMIRKRKRDGDDTESDEDDLLRRTLRRAGIDRGGYTEMEVGQREVEDEPVLDVTLEPGDVLYMPRGWIHQAHTPQDNRSGNGASAEHSLHLTVSTMQRWSWADLLELLMQEAVESSIGSDSSTYLRQGLPKNFLSYMGAIHVSDGNVEGLTPEEAGGAKGNKKLEENENDDNEEEEEEEHLLQQFERGRKKLRHSFYMEAQKRIDGVCKAAMEMVDACCDQLGKRFLSDRLPPALFERELSTTKDRMPGEFRIKPNTMCRLSREGIARLVLENGQDGSSEPKAVLYHCGDNSMEFHGNPLSPMEFELDDAPALEMLLTTVDPRWVCVKDLTHDYIEDKVGVAQALYDEGILSICNVEE